MAEIVRAGILSVDEGQIEASHALGMTRLQTMRRIVLPQAMRVIIPPTGNETISMLKTTLARQRDRLRRAALLGPAHLLGQLQDDPAAARGEHLVPVHDHAAVDRPVLPRAPLRPRQGQARPGLPARSGRACSRCGATHRRAYERADGQGRVGPQALRPARGAEGHLARGAARRGHLHARPVRLRQVDLPALHQPPREDQRGPAVGGRQARGLPPAGRQAVRAARLRGRAGALGDRDGVPALQPVPAHDGARERDRGAHPGEGRGQGHGRGGGQAAARARRAWATRSTAIRRSCRAASSSASRSPGRWPWSRS